MKLYAALPLAVLLLASAAFRPPAVPDTTPDQREALVQQIETVIRSSGYLIPNGQLDNAGSTLRQQAFRLPGCERDAFAVALHFREIALLRAAWARFASTFPDHRLSLRYGDGQWYEINRPAIIWEQVKLQFANDPGISAYSRETAVLVASPAQCDAPAMDWSVVWRTLSHEADRP